MLTADEVRKRALGLPEVVEQDHHGAPSFRVRGKIFATLPDDDHLHVMLDEAAIEEAVQSDPDANEAFWWGKRLAAVRVVLSRADSVLVAELLADAWRRRAPVRLVREHDLKG